MSTIKPRRSLNISPTPFKSSLLAIPPSPFSPRIPLTPTPITHKHTRSPPTAEPTLPTSEAPPNPLAWLWTCHQCHRSYRLGVIRRCLNDGHHFCSGQATAKHWRQHVSKRRQRGYKPCGSEFDYHGWKGWSRWRKDGQRNWINDMHKGAATAKHPDLEDHSEQQNHNPKMGKDCWNECSYPSECRWGKEFGIHTPITTEFPVVEFNTTPTLTAPIEQEGILKLENCKERGTCTGKKNVWEALVATGKRRTNVLSSSPLTFSPQEAEGTSDNDGDVSMANAASTEIEPSSPATSESSVPSTSTRASAAADLVKDFMCQKIARHRRSFKSIRRGHRAIVSSFLAASRPTLVQQEGEVDFANAEAYLGEYAPPGRMGSGDQVGVR